MAKLTQPKFLGSYDAHKAGPLPAHMEERELAFNLATGKMYTKTKQGTIIELGGGSGDANVQSDWAETDTHDDAYIKNKPHIPAPQPPQVQADWNETSATSKAFIRNKPTHLGGGAQSDWGETDTTKESYIKRKPDMTKFVKSDPSGSQVAVKDIIGLSQVEYDALKTKVATTLYIII